MINPYFHTFGLKAGLIASFLRGATMLPVAVFDVDRVLELVAAERVTMLPGAADAVPGAPRPSDRDEYKLSTLRAGVTGAADIPVELIRRITDELPFETLIDRLRAHRGGQRDAVPSRRLVRDVATTGRARRARDRRRFATSPTTARSWFAATA